MGKSQRVEEPAAQERAAAAGHMPVTICGRIEPPDASKAAMSSGSTGVRWSSGRG
jgi:hypothetical protein